MTGMSAARIPFTIVAHRRAEPARRVHLDHDRRVAALLALLDRVEQVVLRDRVDVVLELGDEHTRRRVGGECGERASAAATAATSASPRARGATPRQSTVRILSMQGLFSCGRRGAPPRSGGTRHAKSPSRRHCSRPRRLRAGAGGGGDDRVARRSARRASARSRPDAARALQPRRPALARAGHGAVPDAVARRVAGAAGWPRRPRPRTSRIAARAERARAAAGGSATRGGWARPTGSSTGSADA